MVYKVRLGTLTPAWNPQRPYVPGDRLMGPGRATYWMDESNIVHLTLHPKWGPERHFAGPLPEGRTSHRTAIRLIVGGYVLLIVTGFLGGTSNLTAPRGIGGSQAVLESGSAWFSPGS